MQVEWPSSFQLPVKIHRKKNETDHSSYSTEVPGAEQLNQRYTFSIGPQVRK